MTPNDQTRIGIVGTDNGHAHLYAAFLNGWSSHEPIPTNSADGQTRPYMHLWAAALRELEGDPQAPLPIRDARVTRIWDADSSDAELIARACSIPQVCAEPQDACEDVDAVLVLSGDPGTHLAYAMPALRAGLTTYIDKPLAPDMDTALEIFALADRHGARCFTGSTLHFATEFQSARDVAPERIGPLEAVYASCPYQFEYSSVHAIEMANVLLGYDVGAVRGIKGKNRETLYLEFASGQTAVVEAIHVLPPQSYEVVLYGYRGHTAVELRDFAGIFARFLRSFVATAKGRAPPISATDSLRQMAVVFAAQRSLETGQRVLVSDYLSDKQPEAAASHGG